MEPKTDPVSYARAVLAPGALDPELVTLLVADVRVPTREGHQVVDGERTACGRPVERRARIRAVRLDRLAREPELLTCAPCAGYGFLPGLDPAQRSLAGAALELVVDPPRHQAVMHVSSLLTWVLELDVLVGHQDLVAALTTRLEARLARLAPSCRPLLRERVAFEVAVLAARARADAPGLRRLAALAPDLELRGHAALGSIHGRRERDRVADTLVRSSNLDDLEEGLRALDAGADLAAGAPTTGRDVHRALAEDVATLLAHPGPDHLLVRTGPTVGLARLADALHGRRVRGSAGRLCSVLRVPSVVGLHAALVGDDTAVLTADLADPADPADPMGPASDEALEALVALYRSGSDGAFATLDRALAAAREV